MPKRVEGSFAFDRQAQSFDRRAGLPARVASRAAQAVLELAGVHGLVLDIGAGTGEVGTQLARGSAAYLGIDLSAPMLIAFRRKMADANLVQADADKVWPIADGRTRVIFASRVAHLIRSDHLVRETLRVAHPAGACFVIGRVRRQASSVRAELRREMRRQLVRSGVEARGGGRATERLLARLEAVGGERLPPRRVVSWEVEERPVDALSAWREKSGLAGRMVSPPLKNDILRLLEAWSLQRFGEPTAARRAVEHYELLAMRLYRQRGD